ncbi:MAG: hypothetical protein Q8P51_08915 [Ignavibacteria bacterium]|nr:hypothetical protein [Ignavibacteria bacterium]
MGPLGEEVRAAPTESEIANLKRLAAGIIKSQGNRFVKELLRNKDIRIGENKNDFERNLTEAIQTGALRLDDVKNWLKDVEGWGNQHVYLYKISTTLRKDLTKPKIRARVESAGLKELWDKETVLEFPDEPQLSSIAFDDLALRLLWQESSPGWTAEPEKNYEKEEGLDMYEYRAYRKIETRAITRFEAHLDTGIAGLFIANPIQDEEHQKAFNKAKRVIGLLMNFQSLERAQVDISAVSRNLDQGNIPNSNNQVPEVKAQRSRLASGGAYVEFAANSKDKAYWEEPAIQNVRKAVKTQQLKAFHGGDGVFNFQASSDPGGLTRTLRVQLYGDGNRVRLWAQMNADEVWTILAKLCRYETVGRQA